MKIITTVAFLFVSSFIAKAGESAKSDCRLVSENFRKDIYRKPIETVLVILSREVSSAPDCSCELIKTGIVSFKPRPTEAAAMVDAAITAAPDHVADVVRCAIAAAPDARAEILAVANKFGFTPNPLDYPGVVGEHPGGQWNFTPIPPIFVNPPLVTRVDP